MLTLTRPEIEALIDYPVAAQAIEDAYRAVSLGQVTLPPVGHITFPDHDADCHIKYGHIAGDPIFVIKVATGFPGNAAQGLPTGNGLLLVLSALTGEALALLHDEMMLTDIRTGLGGAIATRLLARKDSQRITIIGSGVQARRQIEAHVALMGKPSFRLWARSREGAERIASDLASIAEITVVDDLEHACRTADVIVTTTGATTPLIHSDWVEPGTHITAIGADAPGKQELETALVARADALFTDLSTQCLDHGEFSTAAKAGSIKAENMTDLGDVLLDPSRGRPDDKAITIADLTGLAAQDIAMARIILEAHGDAVSSI